MSLPTINDVQAVDPILQNILVGYEQNQNRFVADRVFPAVPVDKDSGTYYIFTKKYWFLDEMEQRTPGQQYARIGMGVSTTTYLTLQWALAYPIAEETRANSQIPMDLETAATRLLAQKNLLRKEVAFAADFMATGTWGTDDNNSATDWDDFSSGDPVANVLTAKRTISNNTGMDANLMCLGLIVHEALVNHPDIIDRLKYTRAAGIGAVNSALAEIFDISEYLVARATYSNTNESADFSASAIIDDDCLICYRSASPGLFEASAGYTFAWAPGGGVGAMQPMWRDEANQADLVRIKAQWDQKAVATDVGYFFADIV